MSAAFPSGGFSFLNVPGLIATAAREFFPPLRRLGCSLVLAALAPGFAFAAPDSYLDIQAAIAQPGTAEVGSNVEAKAKARLNIFRTSVNPRVGILVRVPGFGSSGVDTNESNAASLPTNTADNRDYPDYKMVQDLGFDVYLLDWYDGTTYIQKNAMALAELLRLIREGGLQGEDQLIKGEDGAEDRIVTPPAEVRLGPDERLVVLGTSMGGLVARYALAYLEHQGINHRVNSWMSMDSPHAGAYVPIGIQYMTEFLFNLSGGLAARAEFEEVNSPAAQQMLIYHRTRAHESSSPNHSRLFDSFWDELNQVYGGYPKAPGLWRVAFSNGRDDGRTATFVGKDEIAFNLPKSEARLLTFELSDRSVKSSLFGLVIKNPVNAETIFEATIGVDIGFGTTIDVWSLRPHLDRGPVFRSRTGLIFKVGGETIPATEAAIENRIEELLEIPSWIPDGWVSTALEAVVEKIADAASKVATGVVIEYRVDADYAWDFVPGGLSPRTENAAKAVDIWGTSVNLISKWHCFIPATSSLGLLGSPLVPLKNLTAQDTPFDAIYAEPADPGNRSHVQFNLKNGRPNFEFEMKRVVSVPSIAALSPPSLPEGAYNHPIAVLGINFTTNTVVRWNGAARPTRFINKNEIRFDLSATDLQVPGTRTVVVVDPISAVAGNQEVLFEITDTPIRITPFPPAPGDTVHINYSGLWTDTGVPRNPSVTVNGTNILLQATRPSGNVFAVISPYELDVDVGPLAGGTYRVTYSGYPGVATRFFNVHHPAPTITAVDPPAVTSGNQEVRFHLQGTGFLRDPLAPSNVLSQVLWNGTPVPTAILSSELLLADIAPDLLGDRRTNQLAVINPGPGGGTGRVEVLYFAPIVESAVLVNASTTEDSLQLRLRGDGLGEGSTVWWNGVALATERGLDGDLVALVPGSKLSIPGAGMVTVVSSNGFASAMRTVEFVPPPTVRYVKPGTPAGDDGESWNTAYDDLQSALAAAVAGQEIWVAEGVYVTSRTGTPSNHFALVEGVALYGGFRGDEILRDQRNPDPFSNHTVLSGDQLQDGWNTAASRDDNSFHVLTFDDLTDATVLDGFTITGAQGSFEVFGRDSFGGGISSRNSSPRLRNLLVRDNVARYGGGVSIEGGEPELVQVTFSNNSATFGGGVRVAFGGVRLTDVNFVENAASFQGGGLQASGSSTLERVRFLGNAAQDGAGIWLSGGMRIRNAVFTGNKANLRGGAVYLPDGGPPQLTMEHVTVSGNHALNSGGALWNAASSPLLHHCILWGNSAPVDPEISGPSLNPASDYNTIQGGHPTGSHTGTDDPRFVRMPDAGDGDWWTRGNNDYGNLRLRAGSPVVNAGDTNLVPADVLMDLAGKPRVDGASVDLGAYEGGFVTFAGLYPHLQPDPDANIDGSANVLSYLHGENPETAHSWDRKPRLVWEGDRLYLEFVVRVTAGDYRLAMDASDAIPDWLPLPADLGNAMVVVSVQDLPDGIQWRRSRLLADPESQSQRFFRSYSHPLEP